MVMLVGSQHVHGRNSFPKAIYPFQALSGRGPKGYRIKTHRWSWLLFRIKREQIGNLALNNLFFPI